MKCGAAIAALALLSFSARAAAAQPLSAADVVQQISTSLAIDDDDESIARTVDNIRPAEQIGAEAIRVLTAEGAGPRTQQALEKLAARSANLPLAAQPAVVVDSGLDAGQQSALLAKITTYASGYVSALPNMSCTQITRFSSNGRETGMLGGRKPQAKMVNGWRLEDTIVVDVDYYQGTEAYHTRRLNGAPETRPVAELRGSFTQGEFGSILAMTFDPQSQASFHWDHWGRVGGRRVAVFNYSIERAHSQYSVCCVVTGSVTVNGVTHQRTKSWISAYRGLIYAEAETGSIVEFTLHNVDIPEAYRLRDARDLVQYSAVTVGGSSMWLPSRAIHFTHREQGRARDEIQFSDYRKLGAESTLSFPTDDK